jgi:drug/metabolite transporter (DMT)-like permease
VERHGTTGRRRLGLALALTTATLWSTLPIALKRVLTVMEPTTITFYRFMASAAVLGLVLAWRGRLPRLERLGRGGWGLLVVATVFLAGNYLAYLVALDHTTPADAQVVIQLGPLFLALGGIAVFGERFGRTQWTGFVVLLVGLGLFFGSQLAALVLDSTRYVVGNSIMVVAAALWAIYGLAQKQLLRTLPSEASMLCIYAGCAVLFCPLAVPGTVLQLDGTTFALLVFCALNTVVAYGAFAEALQHCEASRVSAVLALTPLGTLLFVEIAERWWPELDFQPGPLPWISLAGAALVVGGSLATALGREEPVASGR